MVNPETAITRYDRALALFNEEVVALRQSLRWGEVIMTSPVGEGIEAMLDRAGDPVTYSGELLNAEMIEKAVFMCGEVPENADAVEFVGLFARCYHFHLPEDIQAVWTRINE